MNDLISRHAAIDELKKYIAVNRNPNHDARIWEEGMNCAVTVIGALPSAQPELIRCKDCKYNSNPPEYGNACCDTFYGMTDQMGFCHMAERREDGRS